MNTITLNPAVLEISGVPELSGAVAANFREEVRRALEPSHRSIEIDMSATAFVDSAGLGALVALHKLASGRGGGLRLINPTLMCRQLLDLTRLSRVFQIEVR